MRASLEGRHGVGQSLLDTKGKERHFGVAVYKSVQCEEMGVGARTSARVGWHGLIKVGLVIKAGRRGEVGRLRGSCSNVGR